MLSALIRLNMLVLYLLGFFPRFFCHLLILKKSENSLRNTIRVSNSLDPGQARRSVGPDLGPNCLQRLSADDTIVGDKS